MVIGFDWYFLLSLEMKTVFLRDKSLSDKSLRCKSEMSGYLLNFDFFLNKGNNRSI